jgi:hypothetical protein
MNTIKTLRQQEYDRISEQSKIDQLRAYAEFRKAVNLVSRTLTGSVHTMANDLEAADDQLRARLKNVDTEYFQMMELAMQAKYRDEE